MTTHATQRQLVVRRVLNNNTVFGELDGAGVVAMGRGLGHGRRPGDRIDPGLLDQVFRPDAATSAERLVAMLADLPLEMVRLAGDFAALAEERLKVPSTQAIILPLADHLTFAIERTREGIVVEYPLRWEVRQLYPEEVAVGELGVALVRHRIGVELPPDEAVALAMHLVNAQFDRQGLTRTVRMTGLINRVLDLIGTALGVAIDRDSMSATRFVTHLRYLFVRLDQHRQINSLASPLAVAVRVNHPDAHVVARRVQDLIEFEVGDRLTEDELLYLTLHIARLASDDRGVTPVV